MRISRAGLTLTWHPKDFECRLVGRGICVRASRMSNDFGPSGVEPVTTDSWGFHASIKGMSVYAEHR